MAGNLLNPTGAGGIGEVFAEQLRRIARARGRERRSLAIDDLARSVQTANAATPFLTRLVSTDRHGQRLALEVALRLDLPFADSVCRLLTPACASPKFPIPLRLDVASRILRSLPVESAIVADLLQSLVRGLKPHRAAERMRAIQQQVPDHPSVDWLCEELETQSAVDCPRCGVRLKRSNLVMHLWQVHRLLMDGNRARDPWKMIEDWLHDYARTAEKDLLERSAELGQQLDSENGLTRVHRLLLSAGLTNEEAQENLTAQAQGRRASLCPHCYALVPQMHESLPQPMSLSRGRVTGHDYIVEVSDRYVFTNLYVATPDEVLHEGSEPEYGLTQRGSVLFLIGPIVLMAFALAIALPIAVLPPLTPVSLVLLGAFLLYLRMRLRRDSKSDPAERAIDHAWKFIVPELHRPQFSRLDAEFLASLAVTSIGRGSPAIREKSIERIGKLTQSRLSDVAVPPEDLAALRCLEMDDAIRLGRDPVPILANELAGVLSAELPLMYAEQLLDAWPSKARDRGQRARLRVLICAKAFDLGFEAGDLHELGNISPEFGAAFASADLEGLTRLRWLWNIKPARPWQKHGSASTVFDLARYPALGGQYLETRPDLLLFQPFSVGDDRNAGAPIMICEEGVVYRDIVVKELNTPIFVKPKPVLSARDFELVIGKRILRFKQEPVLLVKRLQGWTRFLFRDFLPGSKGAVAKRSPAKLRRLIRQKLLTCPECENPFLALRGEVGILTGVEGI